MMISSLVPRLSPQEPDNKAIVIQYHCQYGFSSPDTYMDMDSCAHLAQCAEICWTKIGTV